ncbi:MAG: hypothetical protein NTX56_01025 [Proteobacteria bacterium]|nr:hypothetical protein [Pseudomonadota bacterium]
MQVVAVVEVEADQRALRAGLAQDRNGFRGGSHLILALFILQCRRMQVCIAQQMGDHTAGEGFAVALSMLHDKTLHSS